MILMQTNYPAFHKPSMPRIHFREGVRRSQYVVFVFEKYVILEKTGSSLTISCGLNLNIYSYGSFDGGDGRGGRVNGKVSLRS